MNPIKILATLKLWFGRAGSYIAVGNLAMLSYLFIKSSGVPVTIWIVFPLAIMGFILVGYFDERIGLHRAEVTRANDNNPQIKEIIGRLDRIEKKLPWCKI